MQNSKIALILVACIFISNLANAANFTRIESYGGTFNSEPCLVGNAQGICEGHTGFFSGQQSILAAIAEDINHGYGAKGKFERVSDDLDQIWAYYRAEAKGHPVMARVRTRYASRPFKFGIIRGAEPRGKFEIVASQNGHAKSKLLLSSCSTYKPQVAGGKRRCQESREEIPVYFEDSEEFQFAIRPTTEVAEVAGDWAQWMVKKFAQGVNEELFTPTSSLSLANYSETDQMVTFRFSEPLRGFDGGESIHYIIAFMDSSRSEHRDFNDYVVEVSFARPAKFGAGKQ